jgi:hypothetical protein
MTHLDARTVGGFSALSVSGVASGKVDVTSWRVDADEPAEERRESSSSSIACAVNSVCATYGENLSEQSWSEYGSVRHALSSV